MIISACQWVAKQLARCFTCGRYGGEKEGEEGVKRVCKSERQSAQKEAMLRQEDKAYNDFNEYCEEDCGG